MNEQRFEYGETDLFEWVEVDAKMISTKECVNKLNEQQAIIQQLKEENEQLRQELAELLAVHTKIVETLDSEFVSKALEDGDGV